MKGSDRLSELVERWFVCRVGFWRCWWRTGFGLDLLSRYSIWEVVIVGRRPKDCVGYDDGEDDDGEVEEEGEVRKKQGPDCLQWSSWMNWGRWIGLENELYDIDGVGDFMGGEEEDDDDDGWFMMLCLFVYGFRGEEDVRIGRW